MKLISIAPPNDSQTKHKWFGFTGLDHSNWAIVLEEGNYLVAVRSNSIWRRLGDCGHIVGSRPLWWPEGVASYCERPELTEWWLRQIFNAVTGIESDRRIERHGVICQFDCRIELFDKNKIAAPSKELLEETILDAVNKLYGGIDEYGCSITRMMGSTVQIDSEGASTNIQF